MHSLTPSKTILDSRPKWAKSIPVLRPKSAQKETIPFGTTHTRTELFGLYKGVSVPPGIYMELFIVSIILQFDLVCYYLSPSNNEKRYFGGAFPFQGIFPN